MRTAGLSFQNSTLEAAIFDGKTLLKEEAIALPASSSERTALLKELFLKWKHDHKIEGVAVGLDFGSFSHHIINLPLKSGKDIQNALPFEMERRLPLSPEEYVHGFHTVSTSGKSSKNLVLSVRKEKIGWIAESAKEAGIRLLGIRCSLLEALNEFISSGAASTALFVQPSGHAYHIAGVSGSSAAYLRASRSEDDAKAEIEKTAETFGGVVYAAGHVPFGEAKSLHYSIPKIIALSGQRVGAVSIDFTPGEFLPAKKDYYPYAIGAMSFLAVLFFFLTSIVDYYKDSAALKDILARAEEIKSTSSGLVEIRKNFEEVEKKKAFLLEFRNNSNRNIRILRELSVLLPDGAWLTAFSTEDKNRIKIEGYAARTADIIKPLEKSGLFKNVEFSAPVTVKEGAERFSLRIELEK